LPATILLHFSISCFWNATLGFDQVLKHVLAGTERAAGFLNLPRFNFAL
jgi:hypothetical protein